MRFPASTYPVINDASYTVTKRKKIDGKSKIIWVCPFYRKWKEMLRRCYSDTLKTRNVSYKDCTICEEWHLFSNFKSWMECQDWKGKELDKDVLVSGNKKYSPDTCCFISKKINTFLTHKQKTGGALPIGVKKNNKGDLYEARCSDPFSGNYEYLGVFKTPDDAHAEWRKRKHEISCQYASQESDERIAKALRRMFA